MNRQGGALVDTVVAALLSSALTAASVSLGRLALERRRSLAGARYAAELAASGLPAAVINVEARSFAAALGGDAEVSTRRFLDLPSASFYRLYAGEARGTLARPPLLGGGAWTWTDRAVLEEE